MEEAEQNSTSRSLGVLRALTWYRPSICAQVDFRSPGFDSRRRYLAAVPSGNGDLGLVSWDGDKQHPLFLPI